MKLREGSPVVNSAGVVIGTALPTSAPVRLRTVADAEALFGRGAAVIGARGGVAECLAAVPPLRGVAVEASTPQPDGTHLVRVEVGARPTDLAARCDYPGCRSAATRTCDHCGVLCCGEHGETGEGSGCTLRALAASPRSALNEVYVSRATGDAHTVVAVVGREVHLRDERMCVRSWPIDALAREFIPHEPTAPTQSAGALLAARERLAAENAALRKALAASGELLAEAHAEVERLRGAK